MRKVVLVFFLPFLLTACGGGGGDGDSTPTPPSSSPSFSKAWEGELVYQSSNKNESASLAILGDKAWIKIEGYKAAWLDVSRGGAEISLSGRLYTGWPISMGEQVKHPAHVQGRVDSPDIQLTFTLEGLDAVGSFEITESGTVNDYGVFSLLPITLSDGHWYLKDIPEVEFTCGTSGGHPLYCYSDLDFSIDADNQLSGQYRDFHKYAERPPEMYSTIPTDFEFSGQVEPLPEEGFYRIKVSSTYLEAEGFGYRKPDGELEYCLAHDMRTGAPNICP